MKDIYNMDKTGFQLSQIAGNYVVYDLAVGHSVTSKPDNTQWASIIKYIKVNKIIKPYLIFTDKASEDHMFSNNEELPNIIWIFSFKEWTDNELAIDWLWQIFILQTWQSDKHSILILNNHGSHSTGKFQYYCLQNNIHPLYVSVNTSHKLQPLNVDSFSPLSNVYKHAVQDYTLTGLIPLN